MKNNKFHKFIDMFMFVFPFLLFAIYMINQKNIVYEDFNSIVISLESSMALLRETDFGLSDFVLTHFFNGGNVYLFYAFDIMIYFLWWRLLDIVISLTFFWVDFLKTLCYKFIRGV